MVLVQINFINIAVHKIFLIKSLNIEFKMFVISIIILNIKFTFGKFNLKKIP